MPTEYSIKNLNLELKIRRLFHFLAQFLFTTSLLSLESECTSCLTSCQMIGDRVLANQEIPRKTLECFHLTASTQKLNFEVFRKKIAKNQL